MCPFYYTPQEKFLSRAGIKPKTTSDQLFKTTGLPSSGDSESDEDQIGDDVEDPSVSFEINNSSFVDEEDSEDDSVEEVSHRLRTPSKTNKSASKKKSSMKLPTRSKASNIVSNKKRKQGNDVSGLDNALTALAKDTLRRNRLNDIGKNNVVNDIVILAEQFKRMSDALGSKIKAANACKDFEQFLDREEKRQLQQYKRANEKNLSSSDSSSE